MTDEWDREQELLETLELRAALKCDACVIDVLRSERRHLRHEKRLSEREALMDMASDLTLIGLDPGGTTGWAMLVIRREALLEPDVKILSNIALYTYGEIKGNEHEQVDEIEAMLDAWPGAAIVREDFILRTASKARETLSPVRLGFGIDHLLYARGRTVYVQQPSMAKTTASDERLKEWGLYRPGSEHARDATRHAITFARRAKEQVMLRVGAWPFLKSVAAQGK